MAGRRVPRLAEAQLLSLPYSQQLEEGSQGHGPSGGTDADEERLLRTMREELQVRCLSRASMLSGKGLTMCGC